MKTTSAVKKRSIRRPYEKVKTTLQATDGLLEIGWLATIGKNADGSLMPTSERMEKIRLLADSIYETVTDSPGCLSQMAENFKHGSDDQVVPWTEVMEVHHAD